MDLNEGYQGDGRGAKDEVGVTLAHDTTLTKYLTCWFWKNSRTGCRKSEQECLYAHRDTGFYAEKPQTLVPGRPAVAGRNATMVQEVIDNDLVPQINTPELPAVFRNDQDIPRGPPPGYPPGFLRSIQQALPAVPRLAETVVQALQAGQAGTLMPLPDGTFVPYAEYMQNVTGNVTPGATFDHGVLNEGLPVESSRAGLNPLAPVFIAGFADLAAGGGGSGGIAPGASQNQVQIEGLRYPIDLELGAGLSFSPAPEDEDVVVRD